MIQTITLHIVTLIALCSMSAMHPGLVHEETDGSGAVIFVDARIAGVQEAHQEVELSAHHLYQIRVQFAFAAITLAFSMLHLILFFFLPQHRSNLFFAVFLLFVGLALFFDFQHLIWNDGISIRLHRGFLSLALVFSLRFFYALYRPRLTVLFWLIVGGALAAGLAGVINPQDNFKYLIVMSTVHWIEVVRVNVEAVKKRRQGAWIIAVGFVAFFVFGLYDLGLDINVLDPVNSITNGYPYGLLGIVVATSIYLARNMAQTQEDLLVKQKEASDLEMEQRILEAEMQRKTKEMEEARTLQRSMLPAALPSLPDFELAAFMQTATEVGGDYYDAHVSDAGVVTLAIGDATGHGLKAGMMVAIAKSLFGRAMREQGFLAFFEQCTRSIKQMNLGNLFMGLTLVRIDGQHVTIAAAGMPPVLLYRQHSQEVEVVILKGMPLGAFLDFPYQQYETTLEKGDTVLLMTDGFEELFNSEREMYGIQRIQTAFCEVASLAPEYIIERFKDILLAWRGRQPLEDDVTMLVVQHRL